MHGLLVPATWSPKAAVRGTSTLALARANLRGVAWPAAIQINGQASDVQSLPQAGLPQGPLSPILFLFFNSGLVQRQIDSQGGPVAFVNDFTAWVTRPTAQSNQEDIKAIINEALNWERRSGATFEAEKTAPKAYNRTRSILLSRDKL